MRNRAIYNLLRRSGCFASSGSSKKWSVFGSQFGVSRRQAARLLTSNSYFGSSPTERLVVINVSPKGEDNSLLESCAEEDEDGT